MSKNVTNGNLICKVAVLSSFAELYLSSQNFPEMLNIIEPYVSQIILTERNILFLAKSWISTLYDYSRLNLETDLSDLIPGDQLNSKKVDVYMASVKQVVLPVSSDLN